jgi:hypothetical protein
LNQELMSAYLDGELTVAERERAERLLAESPECRQYLDQLRRQQSALRSIPRPKLAIDLSGRVLQAIEQARPAVPAGVATQRIWWRTWRGVAIAAGTAAAMLLGIYWNSLRGNGELAQPPIGPKPPEVAVDSGTDEPLPPETMVAVRQFQELVKLVAVFDFIVSPEAQHEKLVSNWMARNGIPVQKGILIDRKLEQEILQSRFIGGNKIAAAGGANRVADNVEMLFVRGTIKQIDGVWQEFLTIRGQPNPSVRIRMDLAVAPRELSVFLELNRATGLDVATMKANPGQLRTASAFPLQFAQRLGSVTLTSQSNDSFALQGDWEHTAPRERAGRPSVRLASAESSGAESNWAIAEAPFLLAQQTPGQQNQGVDPGASEVSPLLGFNDPDQPGQAIFIIRNEPAAD